jgi:hypothetical protein
MNHGCRSAEGDSRLAELAAANNITNTRKHSFKDVLPVRPQAIASPTQLFEPETLMVTAPGYQQQECERSTEEGATKNGSAFQVIHYRFRVSC